MKTKLTAALILLLTTYTSHTFSQDFQRPPCVRSAYQSQVDSLKQSLASRGYCLMKEASITMESTFDMPVVMQLEQGNMYHFVFIGDPASLEYQVTMFDWKDRMVFCKKSQRQAADGNVLYCSFEPETSKQHIFRPLQVTTAKSKTLYGYVLMFKKGLTVDG